MDGEIVPRKVMTLSLSFDHRLIDGADGMPPAEPGKSYLQMIWATAYGYLVFAQLPDGLSVLGMAVIVAIIAVVAGMLLFGVARRLQVPLVSALGSLGDAAARVADSKDYRQRADIDEIVAALRALT